MENNSDRESLELAVTRWRNCCSSVMVGLHVRETLQERREQLQPWQGDAQRVPGWKRMRAWKSSTEVHLAVGSTIRRKRRADEQLAGTSHGRDWVSRSLLGDAGGSRTRLVKLARPRAERRSGVRTGGNRVAGLLQKSYTTADYRRDEIGLVGCRKARSG